MAPIIFSYLIIFIDIKYQCHISDYWITIETNVFYETDFEQYPLQIKTDSVNGDGTLIDLTVYDESTEAYDEYFAYIYIRFNDVIQFMVSDCVTTEIPFPTTPPSEQDKVWTLRRNSTALTIECNDVEVVEVIYSDYGDTCVSVWSTDIAKIMFYPNLDTASDEYREGEVQFTKVLDL